VLWIAMGAAGVFVLIALARRFHRRRTGAPTTLQVDDDD
jgi:beta-lactamase regulating signal transducer with metallopeptidase domain